MLLLLFSCLLLLLLVLLLVLLLLLLVLLLLLLLVFCCCCCRCRCCCCCRGCRLVLHSRCFLGSTASIGKDHFGWDAATTLPPLDPKCEEDKTTLLSALYSLLSV